MRHARIDPQRAEWLAGPVSVYDAGDAAGNGNWRFIYLMMFGHIFWCTVMIRLSNFDAI